MTIRNTYALPPDTSEPKGATKHCLQFYNSHICTSQMHTHTHTTHTTHKHTHTHTQTHTHIQTLMHTPTQLDKHLSMKPLSTNNSLLSVEAIYVHK